MFVCDLIASLPPIQVPLSYMVHVDCMDKFHALMPSSVNSSPELSHRQWEVLLTEPGAYAPRCSSNFSWCAAERVYACLPLVFLIKVEVLKPISSARRFDKGELPGVGNLS